MSLAILHCRAQYGTEAPPVTIEVFLSGGLPAFTIVGMAETAVRESKDRVRGALLSSGFDFPQQRITISLGPADMRKTGGRYDLAIALGILAARRQIPKTALAGIEFYGELALSGELRAVPGMLPAVLKRTRRDAPWWSRQTTAWKRRSAVQTSTRPGRCSRLRRTSRERRP